MDANVVVGLGSDQEGRVDDGSEGREKDGSEEGTRSEAAAHACMPTPKAHEGAGGVVGASGGVCASFGGGRSRPSDGATGSR